MGDSNRLNRRAFGKAIVGGVATAGVVGLTGCTGTAEATIEAGIFDVGEVHIEDENGEPDELKIENIEVFVDYQNFEADPDEATFLLRAWHPDEAGSEFISQIHPSNLSEEAPDGTIEKTLPPADFIDEWGLQAFTADDGDDPDEDTTREWEIDLNLEVEVVDEDGRIFEEEAPGSALIQVTNLGNGDNGEESEIEVGGSGDLVGG